MASTCVGRSSCVRSTCCPAAVCAIKPGGLRSGCCSLKILTNSLAMINISAACRVAGAAPLAATDELLPCRWADGSVAAVRGPASSVLASSAASGKVCCAFGAPEILFASMAPAGPADTSTPASGTMSLAAKIIEHFLTSSVKLTGTFDGESATAPPQTGHTGFPLQRDCQTLTTATQQRGGAPHTFCGLHSNLDVDRRYTSSARRIASCNGRRAVSGGC